MYSNCDKCSEESIITMKYSGISLCKQHFIEYFENRVRKTLKEFSLYNKKIVVGLSGGKDSIVMLHILSQLIQKEILIAITIDGGIKDYDDKILENAKKVCNNLGIEHIVFHLKDEIGFSVNDLAKARPGRCNCGISRRMLLNKKSRELNADYLAIGHNLDDESENILLNYINGNVRKLASKSGKNDKFVPRIKPLIRCPEDEVALFASLLYPEMDFSLHCPYRKDVVRNDMKIIIDSLEEKHPGIKFKIFEGAEKIRSLIKIEKTEMKYCSKCGEPSSSELCQSCIQMEEVKKFLKR